MKRLVFLIVIFLLAFAVSPLYAADRTNPPTITYVDGPLTGVIGQTYSFSVDVTSNGTYPLTAVSIKSTSSLTTSQNSSQLRYVTVGSISDCTSTSCTFSANFTPTQAGTYYIFSTANFTQGGSGTSCNSHPSLTETNCLDSRGEYVTFVVTALPEASVFGDSFGYLLGVIAIFGAIVIYKVNIPLQRARDLRGFESKFD